MGYVPKTYADWERCITVDCGLNLTASFIDARIKALEDRDDYRTKKFIEYWGPAHHAQTLKWFHEAAKRI